MISETYRLIPERRKISYNNLQDLAQKLNADFYGVMDITQEMDKVKYHVISHKIFYMAYTTPIVCDVNNPYTAMVTYDYLQEAQDIWVRITKQNYENYQFVINDMLNLYRKKDCPDLLQEYAEAMFCADSKEIDDKLIRDAILSCVINQTSV